MIKLLRNYLDRFSDDELKRISVILIKIQWFFIGALSYSVIEDIFKWN